jgi:tripartite-type tricarboxylate transporter receptor subunit TctC
VPFAAGGPTDTVTRLIAEPMSETLGQQIVVQNVAGAGGTLAAGQVAAAAPDGYTVLMHHIGMSTAPSLYADLPYDPLVDFKPIGLVTEVPMTIIGRADFEPTTLQDLVDYVKENTDTVTYANAGIGAASHLCGLLFMNAIDTELTEVPYDGTGPAMEDLVGGQVDFMCDQTTNTTEQIEAGSVKAYAITSPERNDALPDVPTTAEAGLPDVEVSVWHGLYVPKDTPDEIVQELSDALKAALKDENVVSQFAALGTAPVAGASPSADRCAAPDPDVSASADRSDVVSARTPPGGRAWRRRGPMRTRTRRSTGASTAANMRRSWRFQPCLRTDRYQMSDRG